MKLAVGSNNKVVLSGRKSGRFMCLWRKNRERGFSPEKLNGKVELKRKSEVLMGISLKFKFKIKR